MQTLLTLRANYLRLARQHLVWAAGSPTLRLHHYNVLQAKHYIAAYWLLKAQNAPMQRR